MTKEVACGLMKLVVQGIVRSLVDRPDDVTVAGVVHPDCVVFHVYVAQPDLGYVIGRQGRTISSLRTILDAASVRRGIRFDLNVRGKGQDERRA